MKEILAKYTPRAVLFGTVMTALAYPRGELRFFPDGLQSPPIWLQLVEIFLSYAVIFLLCNILADLIGRRGKK